MDDVATEDDGFELEPFKPHAHGLSNNYPDLVMQWEVHLMPVDDRMCPCKTCLDEIVRVCSKVFHDRLVQHLKHGLIPSTFGPVPTDLYPEELGDQG